jgi:hypothetical protein
MNEQEQLAENQQGEQSIAKPVELLGPSNVKKEDRILVRPEFFEQVLNYIAHSIPKNLTVNETVTLINNLQNTSVRHTVDVTYGPAK